MSIETKVLFPLARGVFCVVGLLLLIATLFFGVCAVFNTALAKAPSLVKVSPSTISAKLTRFGTGESDQETKAGSEPFGRALSPLSQLERKYPGSKIAQLAEMLEIGPINEPYLAILAGKIGEAQDLGDIPSRYVDNAIAVLSGLSGSKERTLGVQMNVFVLYHKERLQRLRDSLTRKQAASVSAPFQTAIAGIAFISLLQVTLILTLFSIENNTRQTEKR